MSKQPPMTGGARKGRRGPINRQPDAKVASENLAGRKIPTGGLTDHTKGKSAGTKDIRRTGGAASKGS